MTDFDILLQWHKVLKKNEETGNSIKLGGNISETQQMTFTVDTGEENILRDLNAQSSTYKGKNRKISHLYI